MQTIPNTHTPEPVAHFHRSRFDAWSFLFTGVTGACTYLIIAILLVILGNIVLNGYSHFSWRFLTGGADRGMYDPETAGVLPMIVGTASRIILMTFFVIPVGVITALYMTEYAHSTSLGIRIIRGAVAVDCFWSIWMGIFSEFYRDSHGSIASSRSSEGSLGETSPDLGLADVGGHDTTRRDRGH